MAILRHKRQSHFTIPHHHTLTHFRFSSLQPHGSPMHTNLTRESLNPKMNGKRCISEAQHLLGMTWIAITASPTKLYRGIFRAAQYFNGLTSKDYHFMVNKHLLSSLLTAWIVQKGIGGWLGSAWAGTFFLLLNIGSQNIGLQTQTTASIPSVLVPRPLSPEWNHLPNSARLPMGRISEKF